MDAIRVGTAVRCSSEPAHRLEGPVAGGAAAVFGGSRDASAASVDLTALHAKIGELTLQNDFLSGALTKFDGRVAGLGARDTLRTEMCYPLHGHELSLSISPVEAGATWAIGWKKDSFWGSEVLRSQKGSGDHRRLVSFVMRERGIPRAEMKVVDSSGAEMGIVTSGTFSPTLKNGIGLALVTKPLSLGDEIGIDIRGKVSSAEVKPAPLVESHVR